MTPRSASGTDVLDRRALNRATLERQLLLRRAALPAVDVVEHLVGMQGQVPLSPYYGLWTRLVDFAPEEMARALVERRLVRVAVMRGTVHLVTAADCLTLRPLSRPIFDRDLRTNSMHATAIEGLDLDELAVAGRELLEERPRSLKELGTPLGERWPARNTASLAYAVRDLLTLVQVPPRGVWGESGQAVCTTAEAWLGRPLDPDPSAEEMITRYFAAFGPATVKDAQTWSGLTRLREVVERLRPRLRTFRDEEGKELFDLPDAPRPDADDEAPPRFLPDYDNVLRSHADRSRVIDDEYHDRFKSRNGVIPGTVLVDGFARAAWSITRRGGIATLTIDPFTPLSGTGTAAVTEEGARLLAFAADGLAHDIRFTAPT